MSFALWGKKLLEKHGKTIEAVGKILQGSGDCVPIFGTPIKAFGSLVSHIGRVGAENEEEANKLRAAIESLMEDLERVGEKIEKFTREQKNKSKLYQNVKVTYEACQVWAKQIEEKKQPKDLLSSITRKASRLQKAVQEEILGIVVEIDQKLIGLSKPPTEYYEEGKIYLRLQDWMKAREAFNAYHRYFEAGHVGIKKPEEDHHFLYLADITDALNKQMEASAELYTFPTVKTPENKWRQLAIDWEKRYRTKGLK